MTIKEFHTIFEQMAPSAIAWKGDNVGIQIGNASDRVSHILIALDLTMEVAREAKKKNANLIVTHHPLLFHPIKSISNNSRVGELIQFLIQNRINVFSTHTNLDSVPWGVNFVLAKSLGVHNIEILSPMREGLTKVSVFVPHSHIETVADAMHKAGAGTFTKYDHCSFRTEGTGTFRGMNEARPFIGTVGTLERTKEVRLEMLCETWKTHAVITAMKESHPYEEIAYDVYPLLNTNAEYGLGAVGTLETTMSSTKFLAMVQRVLKVPTLRFTGTKRMIRTVAVCGGSGSELIPDAIRRNADAMVTADLKYHTFQDYEHRLLLVDAGHYETERLVLPTLARKLKKVLNHKTYAGNIFVTQYSTNPVHYYRRSN